MAARTLPVRVEQVFARLNFLSQIMGPYVVALLFGQAFSLSPGMLADFLRAWRGETGRSSADDLQGALSCDLGRVCFLMTCGGRGFDSFYAVQLNLNF